jgi:hypothetical protein
VSKSNRVYETDEGRFEPKELKLNTIKRINDYVKSLFVYDNQDLINNILLKIKNDNELDISDWRELKKYSEHKTQIGIFEKTFNVLENEFFEWKFDEIGVTRMVWHEKENDKLFVVFVDVHS